MAQNSLNNFEGSQFRDPLANISEVVSKKHMGVCTEERPVMHWVSELHNSFIKKKKDMENSCTCDGYVASVSSAI